MKNKVRVTIIDSGVESEREASFLLIHSSDQFPITFIPFISFDNGMEGVDAEVNFRDFWPVVYHEIKHRSNNVSALLCRDALLYLLGASFDETLLFKLDGLLEEEFISHLVPELRVVIERFGSDDPWKAYLYRGSSNTAFEGRFVDNFDYTYLK